MTSFLYVFPSVSISVVCTFTYCGIKYQTLFIFTYLMLQSHLRELTNNSCRNRRKPSFFIDLTSGQAYNSFHNLAKYEGIDQQLSPTESEETTDSQKEQSLDSEPTLEDSVRIKTEPRKSSDGEDEVDGLAPTTENSTKLQSPKRKLNGEAHHEGTEVLRLHSKIPRASESPNAAAKKLHPDPLGLLIRAFPSQCRSVLELVLQGCGGNVVQAIECLLQNQEKKQLPLPMPIPVIGSVGAPPPSTVHPALHFQGPSLFRKPEPFAHGFHRPPLSPNCPYPPPPPLMKPKAHVSAYPFSMENVLASPPSNANVKCGSTKEDDKPVLL
ncbi:Doublesex- and mab-3-related transcription factor A2 [Acropora cervicornis]|uniref:Doublesex- and mab-3-related transcription factor A2 n=1 Tax=Acropora cervicornis TaxID=6130 RepID=A0AAD9QFJ3_ACRCE|nr:Doublesex- and mab-3-related transcription factor A2 [Acropora cervicornis]